MLRGRAPALFLVDGARHTSSSQPLPHTSACPGSHLFPNTHAPRNPTSQHGIACGPTCKCESCHNGTDPAAEALRLREAGRSSRRSGARSDGGGSAARHEPSPPRVGAAAGAVAAAAAAAGSPAPSESAATTAAGIGDLLSPASVVKRPQRGAGSRTPFLPAAAAAATTAADTAVGSGPLGLAAPSDAAAAAARLHGGGSSNPVARNILKGEAPQLEAGMLIKEEQGPSPYLVPAPTGMAPPPPVARQAARALETPQDAPAPAAAPAAAAAAATRLVRLGPGGPCVPIPAALLANSHQPARPGEASGVVMYLSDGAGNSAAYYVPSPAPGDAATAVLDAMPAAAALNGGPLQPQPPADGGSSPAGSPAKRHTPGKRKAADDENLQRPLDSSPIKFSLAGADQEAAPREPPPQPLAARSRLANAPRDAARASGLASPPFAQFQSQQGSSPGVAARQPPAFSTATAAPSSSAGMRVGGGAAAGKAPGGMQQLFPRPQPAAAAAAAAAAAPAAAPARGGGLLRFGPGARMRLGPVGADGGGGGAPGPHQQ
jgi:hypothetical protein